MKTRAIILFIAACSLASKAQVAISYYPFQSLLSVSTNTEKLFWADYRIETNTFISNLNMELSPMLNIKRTERVNYYLGAGVSFNPAYAVSELPVLGGYFIDTGVRIKPFPKYKGVQILFEISPYVNARLSGGNLRTRLGLAYNFSRKKTNNEQ